MSILLIGQKSVAHPRQYWLSKQQRMESKRVKKQKQIKYQIQLLQQIQQKKERMRREKQLDLWSDKKRELVILRELTKRYEKQPKSQFNQQNIESISENLHKSMQPNKYYSFNLPSIYYRNNDYESQYWRSFRKPNEPYYRQNYHKPRKLKTQNSVYKSYHNDLDVAPIIQNPQEREKELKQHQNRKFKEVYELLDRSIDIFDQTNSRAIQPKIAKKIVTFDQKNRLRSANNLFEAEKDFYQLPYTSQKRTIKSSLNNEQEKEWRAWYAKEKLRQLQQYYKNQELKSQVEDKLLGINNSSKLKQSI